MKYWIMKSEPSVFGIGDLEKQNKPEPWDGVRNYQARNFMKNEMRIGDCAFFYHSNCKIPGIAGEMYISKEAYPDKTQFDKQSKYFDPKATKINPIWFNVEVTFKKKFNLIPLQNLKGEKKLLSLKILQKGNRLSITPLSEKEWNVIYSMS